MTQLEKEIIKAFESVAYIETIEGLTEVERPVIAKAIAEVAKRYMEQSVEAYSKEVLRLCYTHQEALDDVIEGIKPKEFVEKWLKENGVI